MGSVGSVVTVAAAGVGGGGGVLEGRRLGVEAGGAGLAASVMAGGEGACGVAAGVGARGGGVPSVAEPSPLNGSAGADWASSAGVLGQTASTAPAITANATTGRANSQAGVCRVL
jgi:hypothetical protein